MVSSLTVLAQLQHCSGQLQLLTEQVSENRHSRIYAYTEAAVVHDIQATLELQQAKYTMCKSAARKGVLMHVVLTQPM